MTDSKLRIGLVGLGDIAVRAHLPALAADPRVSLVAVAEVDPDRLASLAPRGVRATRDADSVFADQAVDAVVIATPPAATPGLIQAALET
ncbi:MAG: Gfo/Idh/MocA family oxidoreductase, partial [Actinobacteria bacterium]|nr:Gfo/Idh/MocA family oxidoreductase [Actinomycetota bacterium]